MENSKPMIEMGSRGSSDLAAELRDAAQEATAQTPRGVFFGLLVSVVFWALLAVAAWLVI